MMRYLCQMVYFSSIPNDWDGTSNWLSIRAAVKAEESLTPLAKQARRDGLQTGRAGEARLIIASSLFDNNSNRLISPNLKEE
jgi:hypothetical protein